MFTADFEYVPPSLCSIEFWAAGLGIATATTGALIGGTALTVGAGLYESSQADSIASESEGLAATTAGEQQYYNSLLQSLISNPSSVSSLPGYQFQLSQGSAAVADQMGASGFAGSGNEAAALTQFGQGLASSFYGQQSSLLASLSGVTAASSPSSSASAATSASATGSSALNNLLSQLGMGVGLYGSLSNPSTTAAAGTPSALGQLNLSLPTNYSAYANLNP